MVDFYSKYYPSTRGEETGRFWVLRPKIMTKFGCHTHFKILLEVPNPNIFSSNLDELERFFILFIT